MVEVTSMRFQSARKGKNEFGYWFVNKWMWLTGRCYFSLFRCLLGKKLHMGFVRICFRILFFTHPSFHFLEFCVCVLKTSIETIQFNAFHWQHTNTSWGLFHFQCAIGNRVENIQRIWCVFVMYMFSKWCAYVCICSLRCG